MEDVFTRVCNLPDDFAEQTGYMIEGIAKDNELLWSLAWNIAVAISGSDKAAKRSYKKYMCKLGRKMSPQDIIDWSLKFDSKWRDEFYGR
jgi:hypothetical protein